MKKFAIAFLFSFLIINSNSAQLGLKLGINASATPSYKNYSEEESVTLKLGYQGGLIYNYYVTDKINILTELNYEIRGSIFNLDYDIDVSNVQNTIPIFYNVKHVLDSRSHYINIPILAVFGKSKLKFYLGPNMGWLLKANGKYHYETKKISTGESNRNEFSGLNFLEHSSFQELFDFRPIEDKGSFFAPLEFGINLGVLLYFKKKYFVDLRFNQGLIDLTNNAYDYRYYQTDLFEHRKRKDRNISFQFSLGYFFNSK